MWTEVKNSSRSLHEEPQELNLTQIISRVSSRLPTNSDKNGSITAHPPPLAETPIHRQSGIIPGAIAAALFIGFLLALYAVLWKCMVTQPKRCDLGKTITNNDEMKLNDQHSTEQTSSVLRIATEH